MKRILLWLTAVAVSFSVFGCMGSDLESRVWMFGSDRKKTTNDVMQSWVGSHADDLITSWGVPQASYRRQDGSTLLTWKEIRNGQYICEKTFLADSDGVITRWKYDNHHCPQIISGTVPKTTPIPQPSL